MHSVYPRDALLLTRWGSSMKIVEIPWWMSINQPTNQSINQSIYFIFQKSNYKAIATWIEK
jgi:hypothetical protein